MHEPRRCSTVTTQPSWRLRTPLRPTGTGVDAGPTVTVTIDQVAIDRRLAGDMAVKLTKYEKREAARQAIARGFGWDELTQLTQLSGASIKRALAESLPAVDEPIGWWPTEYQLSA